MFFFLHLYKTQTQSRDFIFAVTNISPVFFQTGEMCLSCQIIVSWIHLSWRNPGHLVASRCLVPLYRRGHTPVVCFAKNFVESGAVETRSCLVFFFMI